MFNYNESTSFLLDIGLEAVSQWMFYKETDFQEDLTMEQNLFL